MVTLGQIVIVKFLQYRVRTWLPPMVLIISLPLAAAVFSPRAQAAELLVVEQDNCPYCRQFQREIVPIYPKTGEARIAPMVFLDLHGPWPEKYANIERGQVTPTFILVNDGAEISRLHGYRGDEFFWFLLGEMLEQLP